MTDYKEIKSFDELIEKEYGKIGADSRSEYEGNAQMFIESEMLVQHESTANHSLVSPSPTRPLAPSFKK
jgi:hypothetical protein